MRRRTALALLVVLPVLAALAVAAVWTTTDHETTPPTTTGSAAVARQALHDLVQASDTVVVGEIVRVDASAVDLRVGEVLTGAEAPDELRVLLGPGASSPLPAVGTDGIWFLVAAPEVGPDTYRLAAAGGSFLVDPADPDRFLSGGGTDPAAVALESTRPFILRHQIQEAGDP